MKKGLKISILAAFYSAAFLVAGNNVIDAYTYSGGTYNVNQVDNDENDFIVTNSAFITSTNNLTPHKVKKEKTAHVVETPKTLTGLIVIMPTNISIHSVDGECEFYENINEEDYKLWGVSGLNQRLNAKGLSDGFYEVDGHLMLRDPNELKIISKYWYSTAKREVSGVSRKTISYTIKETTYTDDLVDLGEASISIFNNSTFISKGNIQTSKAINVSGTSKLNTATGTITGGTIVSDGDIVAQSNYSAPSGKSTISGATITSNGALTASKDIKATTGSISGSVIQATGGNIVSNNSIKASGKVKGNALNVGVINASSASITGNQSISGIFTTSGQAKLNGGASLGNKKITGLGAGTLSGNSTEAVNGSQLYTITQKLASAGKAYTAGSDIAISSANAISVSKTGTIKSGDTGIVTGGAVYTETNSLNTKLNGLKDLVNSHQTTISSLQQQMGDLNQTISDINSNVASATSNLANQLKNCLKSDLGNLSAAGRTAIKTIVSDSLKSMGRQSSQTLTSSIATFEAPSVPDTVTTKDVDSIHTSLKDKLDKSALSTVSENVDSNTKQIGVNADNIHTNTSSIESLKSGKADVSGSNIDSSAYATKLGTGSVIKGDSDLVSGDTVYGALDKKVDISYVDSRIGMMENQMAGIRQQATHDMNRVGAGASALAGLHPSAYDASDKVSFATGYGHYKNANTSALGAFYHPNEKTMVSVAGTIGNNDAMLSAGVSIKLGMSDHVSKVMVTPKMFSAQQVTNENMKDHIATQSQRLHQIEIALQNR